MFARRAPVVTWFALTGEIIYVVEIPALRDPRARVDHVVRDRARGAAALDANRIALQHEQPRRAPLGAFVLLAKLIFDPRMRQPRVVPAKPRTNRQTSAAGGTARTRNNRRHHQQSTSVHCHVFTDVILQ